MPARAAALCGVLSANVHRRHMTKGQRAMAVAMIYPAPVKLKRGGSSVTEHHGISKGKLSQARTVLKYSIDGDLADGVLSGALKLDATYETARARKMEKSFTDQIAELRTRYPDLADKVVDEEARPRGGGRLFVGTLKSNSGHRCALGGIDRRTFYTLARSAFVPSSA